MAATGTEADVSPPLPRRKAKGLGYENQWALTWRKFTRHRLGVAGGVVVLLLYIVVLIPEFLAPVTLDDDNTKYAYAPPQAIKLGLSDEHGWHFEPHVDAYKAKVDYNSGKRLFTARQRKAVVARDGGGCALPGCGLPARYTELHHLTWWSRGGRTDLDQAVPLCDHHHDDVHDHDIRISRNADGSYTFAYPDGRLVPGSSPPDEPAHDEHRAEASPRGEPPMLWSA